MASVADQLQLNKLRLPSTQIFFAVCAVGWIPFIASAFNYQTVAWFPWLLSARIFAMALALVAALITYFVPRLATHSELAYSLLCVALQASFGILEGRDQTAFTNFVSVFVLMTAIFTRHNLGGWLRFGFLPATFLSLLPLAFKDASLFRSVAVFVDTFSPIVCALAICFVIGHSTCTKNAVLARNKKLSEELTDERDHQKEIIEQQLRELETTRVSAALAQAAQMLAHDVRRPFSMLRMTVDGLLRSKSADETVRLASVALPDVKIALEHADALVRDVMDLSTDLRINQTSIVPSAVLNGLVFDFKKTSPSVDLSLKIDSGKSISADSHQIRRVFENILINAAEAMNGSGRIKIGVSDVTVDGCPFVRLMIWNSGSTITHEDAARIFDAFFTKGKSNGKGLGLAIAKKIVSLHGGRIWCEPHAQDGVSFLIDLPAVAGVKQNHREAHKSEAEAEAEFSAVMSSISANFDVLIVDDERLYRDALSCMMTGDDAWNKLRIHEASNANEAIGLWKDLNPRLVILDIDLGRNSISGLDILSQMRASGNAAFVCIHSNRMLDEQTEFAKEHGANAISPKPISRIQLMNTLIEAVSSVEQISAIDAGTSSKRFAFVDDSIAVRTLWQMDWPEGTLETFASPEDFWKRANNDNGFLGSLSAVFTDLYFGEASSTNGKDFAKKLKERYEGAVFVASDARGLTLSEQDGVSAVIRKDVPTREALAALLA